MKTRCVLKYKNQKIYWVTIFKYIKKKTVTVTGVREKHMGSFYLASINTIIFFVLALLYYYFVNIIFIYHNVIIIEILTWYNRWINIEFNQFDIRMRIYLITLCNPAIQVIRPKCFIYSRNFILLWHTYDAYVMVIYWPDIISSCHKRAWAGKW